MDGLFLENGPWRMNPDQTLRLIDGSWNEYANVLYGRYELMEILFIFYSWYLIEQNYFKVDQPVGTGFSFTNQDFYVRNATQVPQQFLLFLDKFFEIFPEYSQDDVSLFG